MRYFFHYVAFLLYLSVGAATLPHLEWYRSLTLPSFALPPVAVSVAWLAVFISVAVSASALWSPGHPDRPHRLSAWYAGLLLLVVLWNYLFFGTGMLAYAAGVSLVITLIICVTILSVRGTSRAAALALTPFLLWMLYATYFNYALSALNP